ncbi:MAG: amidohydrolase [Clostridia bacterium]|nr:amidohydrolase [Clostridia bacterium]
MEGQLKLKINKCIDKRRKEIIQIGEEIYNTPETGFKEFQTSQIVKKKFQEIGLKFTPCTDIPGGKATIDTGKEGPRIAILGELDSVVCKEHIHSNKTTGAVHACGHNIQIADMIGAAMGIVDSGIIDELSGKIHFIAAPAEEYIEIAYRKELRDKGTIKYLAGKPEFLHRGLFDDVDIAVMIHANPMDEKFGIAPTFNGCLIKKIRYLGKASHAGVSPHEGINALYAANLGIAAINYIRETFQEKDYIRVHPIMTKGGSIVNIIPSDVQMETFIRGKTIDAIMKTNKKVNQALIGGAIAMGAMVEIEDIPGYCPLKCDDNLISIARELMKEFAAEEEIKDIGHRTGSTDLGDLSTLMPVIHPYIGGVKGGLHSTDFRIIQEDIVYILGSKLLIAIATELLWNKGEKAKKIINKFTPIFHSKGEYFKYVDNLFCKRLLPDGGVLRY